MVRGGTLSLDVGSPYLTLTYLPQVVDVCGVKTGGRLGGRLGAAQQWADPTLTFTVHLPWSHPCNVGDTAVGWEGGGRLFWGQRGQRQPGRVIFVKASKF